jgi:hypothetical protein
MKNATETTQQVNVSKIHVDSKTAVEASKALAISDKKVIDKKENITSNETTFMLFLITALQTWLKSNKTVHGQAIETCSYQFLFTTLKQKGYSLLKYGALDKTGKSKNLDRSNIFPLHVEGKTKLLSDGVIYRTLKNATECKVFDSEKKRYIHYVNNMLHVFHVPLPETLPVESEKVELKKKLALDMAELEKQSKEQDAKKASEAKKVETSKEVKK